MQQKCSNHTIGIFVIIITIIIIITFSPSLLAPSLSSVQYQYYFWNVSITVNYISHFLSSSCTVRTEAIERVRYVQKVALDARLFTSNKQPLSIYLLMKCAWREPGTALSFEAASWRRRFHWTARHRRQLEHLENLEPPHRHHRIIIIIISSSSSSARSHWTKHCQHLKD